MQNSLTVFLGPKPCKVTSLTLQVDNNDDYKVSWVDSKTLATLDVSVVPAHNWGMSTVTVPVNAYTDAFTIRHDENGAGDDLYAISEFQAKGSCGKGKE